MMVFTLHDMKERSNVTDMIREQTSGEVPRRRSISMVSKFLSSPRREFIANT
jgi:hypothetical protein